MSDEIVTMMCGAETRGLCMLCKFTHANGAASLLAFTGKQVNEMLASFIAHLPRGQLPDGEAVLLVPEDWGRSFEWVQGIQRIDQYPHAVTMQIRVGDQERELRFSMPAARLLAEYCNSAAPLLHDLLRQTGGAA